MVYSGRSLSKWMIWGYPISGNLHMGINGFFGATYICTIHIWMGFIWRVSIDGSPEWMVCIGGSNRLNGIVIDIQDSQKADGTFFLILRICKDILQSAAPGISWFMNHSEYMSLWIQPYLLSKWSVWGMMTNCSVFLQVVLAQNHLFPGFPRRRINFWMIWVSSI